MPYTGRSGFKFLPGSVLCAFFVLVFVAFMSAPIVYAQSTNIQDLGPRRNLFKIDDIQVSGLKKVEKEAVLEKISARKGMTLDNYLLKRDLEKIYNMRFFETVEAHQETKGKRNILVFKVKEKPIITKIMYRGNDELSEDDFKDKVKTKVYAILDISTIQSDVVALQKLYEEKGYYLASVRYDVVKLNDENVELIFDIKEYDKVRVKKVAFLGNKAFSDAQLKDIMETREESYFSWMSGAGNFKELNFQT